MAAGWTAHFPGLDKGVIIALKRQARRYHRRTSRDQGIGDPPLLLQVERAIVFPGWDRSAVDAALEFAWAQMGGSVRVEYPNIEPATPEELKNRGDDSDAGDDGDSGEPPPGEELAALRIEVNRLRGELWKAKEQAVPKARPETPMEWADSNTNVRDLADWVTGQARTLGFGETPSVVLQRIAEHAKHRGFTVAEIWSALIRKESVPIDDLPLDDAALRERVATLERDSAGSDPAPSLERDDALLRELDAIVGGTSGLPSVVQDHLLATLDPGKLAEDVKTARIHRELWSKNRNLSLVYRSALNKAEATFRTLQRVDAEYPGGELAVHVEATADDSRVRQVTLSGGSPGSNHSQLLQALREQLDAASPPGDDGGRSAYAYAQAITDYLRLVRIRARLRLDVVPSDSSAAGEIARR